MAYSEKWTWIPLIVALGMGAGIPLLFVDFVEGSWQDRIYLGILSTTAMFAYALIRRVGKRKPLFAARVRSSLVGMTFLVFAFTLIASCMAVAFAVLPIPRWLHVAAAIVLAIGALSLFVAEKSSE